MKLIIDKIKFKCNQTNHKNINQRLIHKVSDKLRYELIVSQILFYTHDEINAILNHCKS